MVFSSYVFILLFLPITLGGYYLSSVCKRSLFQRLFLIAASLFFYAYFNVSYLLLIIASIAVNYIVAGRIQKSSGGISQLNTVVGQAGYLNFPTGIDIPYVIVYILLLLTVVFACRNSASLLDRFAVSSKTPAVSSILFLVTFLCLSRQSVFIYFNF